VKEGKEITLGLAESATGADFKYSMSGPKAILFPASSTFVDSLRARLSRFKRYPVSSQSLFQNVL
jgi:hypothetical protein